MTFKRTTLEETLAVSPLLVLDGAMSTPLENMGIDLNTKLWTAKVLADQPEMVKQVHKNYFKAGADCGITCSYQATVPGLMDIGYTKEQAEELIAKSVEIFLKAREEWWQEEGEKAGHTWPLCLASVGPYGAYLADGQKIGNRFCHVNSGRLICSENVRHDVDQREQQDKFSGDSDYDRCFCVSNGSKGHLAGHLDAEQQDGSHVDPKCMSSKG